MTDSAAIKEGRRTDPPLVTAHFMYEKTTPGTNRYMEVDVQGNKLTPNDGAIIGTLYIRKTAGDLPKRFHVDIYPD